MAADAHSGDARSLLSPSSGWLCAHPPTPADWAYLLSLADSISHSEAASKEAARALRKEFKYGEFEPQKRAAKIWGILTINASDRFKLQIASKRFLEVVEDTITSPKTPLSVKERMLTVLAVLAYQVSFRERANVRCVAPAGNSH